MNIWWIVSAMFGLSAGLTAADGPRLVTAISVIGILLATFHEYVEVAIK